MSLVHSLDLRGIRDCLVIEYPVHNRRSFAQLIRRRLTVVYTRGVYGSDIGGEERGAVETVSATSECGGGSCNCGGSGRMNRLMDQSMDQSNGPMDQWTSRGECERS